MAAIPERPKIHHFAASVFGGAGIAARRLFDSQVAAGMDVTFWANDSDPKADPAHYKVYEPPLKSGIMARLGYRMKRNKVNRYNQYFEGRPAGYETFHHSEIHIPTILPTATVPDIIHLHWISGMIDYPSFFASIPNTVPIVWTLHDMHPFTGGCHYAWECDQYKGGCMKCPQLGPFRDGDLAQTNSIVKVNSLLGKQLYIAADSHWLASEANNSAVFRHARSIECIHYGIDLEAFSPMEQAEARKQLNLATEGLVLAFGADSVDNKRKGFEPLQQALQQLSDRGMNITCLVFGRGQADQTESGSIKYRYQGHVDTIEKQRLIYSAADAFVIPSLYEAFGQTSLESMACARPVVGFDTGGIPDMIVPGETGLLAERGNASDLAHKLAQLLEDAEGRQRMGQNARKKAETDFNFALQLGKYDALYAKALEG